MPERPMDTLVSPEAADELDRLRRKHQQCEDRLAELRGRLFLTEEEKVEEVRLKKQKLMMKDRMEAIHRALERAGDPDPR